MIVSTDDNDYDRDREGGTHREELKAGRARKLVVKKYAGKVKNGGGTAEDAEGKESLQQGKVRGSAV